MSKVCAWCDQEIHPDELIELYGESVHEDCAEEAKHEIWLQEMEAAEHSIDCGEFANG